MKYAYYPGCSSKATGSAFEMSTQYIAKKIGMELVEIEDWNCCGASAAHLTSPDLAVALPARSLALAEKMAEKSGEHLDVTATCAACFLRLKNAVHYARASEENRQHVEDLLEMPYQASADVFCMLDILSRPEAMEAIKPHLQKSLNGLKVASYYGCLLVRPAEVCQFDDTEDPMTMDNLMALAGAAPVDWAFKTECCGASHQVAAPKIGKVMIDKILQNAQANGAEAIATACPLCMLNLDMREGEMNKKKGHDYDMPVYFFTELLAMAMGAEAKEIGIDKHFFPAIERVNEALNRPPVEAKPKRPTAAAKPDASTVTKKAPLTDADAALIMVPVPDTCGEPTVQKGGADA